MTRMKTKRLRSRLFNASENLREDGRTRYADLMVEAADCISAMERTPERLRDIKFQKQAMKFLKGQRR